MGKLQGRLKDEDYDRVEKRYWKCQKQIHEKGKWMMAKTKNGL